MESSFTGKDLGTLLHSKLNRIQQYALVTKAANCILSGSNEYIGRSSGEGIHLCSALKGTSKSSVEFPSTKQTDTLEQVL